LFFIFGLPTLSICCTEKLLKREAKLCMKRAVDPKAFRYKLAQFFLRALYGKRKYYVSPWMHPSLGVCAFLFHDGKVLLMRRGAKLENPHCLDTPGGHVNLEAEENLLDTLKREVEEETGILLDTNKLNIHQPRHVRLLYGVAYHEQKEVANLCIWYLYYLSDDEVNTMRESEEAYGFIWADEDKLKDLIKAGEFEGLDWADPLLKIFKEGKNFPVR